MSSDAGSNQTPGRHNGWLSPETSNSIVSEAPTLQPSFSRHYPSPPLPAQYFPPQNATELEIEDLYDPDLEDYPELLQDEWALADVEDMTSHVSNRRTRAPVRFDTEDNLRATVRSIYEREYWDDQEELDDHRKMMVFLDNFEDFQKMVNEKYYYYPEKVWIEILLDMVPNTEFWIPVKQRFYRRISEYTLWTCIKDLRTQEGRRHRAEYIHSCQELFQGQNKSELEEEPEPEEDPDMIELDYDSEDPSLKSDAANYKL